MKRRILFWSVFCIGALCLFGCTSSGRQVEVGEGAAVGGGEILLSKGASTMEVLEELGEPDDVQEQSGKFEGIEVWVYEDRTETVRQVAVDTIDVPYINMITGEVETRPEMVHEDHVKVSSRTLKLVMTEGILVGWTMESDEDSGFQ